MSHFVNSATSVLSRTWQQRFGRSESNGVSSHDDKSYDGTIAHHQTTYASDANDIPRHKDARSGDDATATSSAPRAGMPSPKSVTLNLYNDLSDSNGVV